MRKANYIFPYYGGKMRMIEEIKSLLPIGIDTYMELCGGGGSIVLNVEGIFKERVYNEIDARIYNVFAVLKDEESSKKFIEEIFKLEITREIFDKAKKEYDNQYKEEKNAVKQAISTYIAIAGSWNNEKEGYVKKHKSYNSKHYVRERLNRVAEILREVQIRNDDCFDIIRKNMDEENVFMYIDVPYPHVTRKGSKTIYGEHEWNDEKHIEFAKIVSKSKSKIMISSYEYEKYDEILVKDNGWKKVMMKGLRSPSGKTREIKEEMAYINYDSYSEWSKYKVVFI